MTPARRASLRLAPLVLLALPPGPAEAQNADGVLLGSEAAATGGAVLATTRDVAGAFYNPAGLGALEGSTLQISASAYELSSLHLSGYLVTTLPWTRAEESVQATSIYPIPSVAAYGLRLRPGLGVALGLWVPSRQEVAFASDFRSSGPYAPGGSITRADYEQHLRVSQKLERTYLGAAAGVALATGLRAGLAAFVSYDRSENFLSLFAAATTDSPVPGEQGGTVAISVGGAPVQLAARASAGLQWDVHRAVTVALSVRAPSLVIARRGEVTAGLSSTTLLPGAPPSFGFGYARSLSPPLSEPWRLAAGTAAAMCAWSLRVEGDWQGPTTGRRAVVNGRIGILHEAGAHTRWGAGLFTDRSRERADALAVDYYGLAAGVDARPPYVRDARGTASWDVRTSLGIRYAAGFGRVPPVEVNPLGSTGPATGSRPVRAHVLTLSVGGLVQF